MSLRSLAWFPPTRKRRLSALAVVVLTLCSALPSRASDFTDSGGRRVMLPPRISRVLAAEPVAAVLVFVLTPQKLVGWPLPSRRGQMPAKYARLPATGAIAGPNPAAAIDAARRLRPDLIIDCSPVDAARVAFADQVQQATGIPYILVDDSVARIPGELRDIGAALGVGPRGDDLALYGEYAINSLRGRLLIQPADHRPRVYYGRGPSGLDAARPGTPAGEIIGESGAINVAAALNQAAVPGQPPAVMTAALLHQWDPEIIIAEDRAFYNSLHRDPMWRGLSAVRKKAVYLAPSAPFGWIDDPDGINRLIGLYWLSTLFYPNENQEDLRSQVHDFYNKFYGMTLSDSQVEAMVRPAGIPPNATPTLGQLPSTALPSGPGMTTVPGGRPQPRSLTPPGDITAPTMPGPLPAPTTPAPLPAGPLPR